MVFDKSRYNKVRYRYYKGMKDIWNELLAEGNKKEPAFDESMLWDCIETGWNEIDDFQAKWEADLNELQHTLEMDYNCMIEHDDINVRIVLY